MPKWQDVRHELDKGHNFRDVADTPWYSDAVYEHFSDAEFGRRHRAARQVMQREGLDALILTGSPNNYSLGGLVTWACGFIPERGMCQYVLLPKEGAATLFYPHGGAHQEAARRIVAAAEVRGTSEGYGKAIADRLTELGLAEGRIGVSAADRTGPEYMGAYAKEQLQAELPKLELVLLPKLLHELTCVKGAEEISAMRRAGTLAVAALEAVYAASRPTRREYELAAAAAHAMQSGGGKPHLTMIATTSMADPKATYPNPYPSARELRSGDIVMNELSARYLGYSAKIGHPITVGPPSNSVAEMFDKTLPIYRTIEALLGPELPLTEVRNAGKAFRAAGMQCRPMLLHGIDMITSDPKVNVDRVIGNGFDETLQPGMVVNIEGTPINAEGTLGLFLSRTYAITESGAENLTPYPLDKILVVQ